MKKTSKILIAGVIAATSILGFSGVDSLEAASAKPKLAVLVDARKVKFQGGDPIMEKGHVQVPLRGVGEALKAKIGFTGKTVSYMKDGRSIVLTIGSKQAVVNGKKVTMDTPAKAVNGRTYVPLRFVSENLGVPVSWDQVGNWVWIGSKDIPSSDDKKFKLQPMSKFDVYYKKSPNVITNFKEEVYKGVKVITPDDLPIQLGDMKTVYSVEMVKKHGKDYIAVRSNMSGLPIALLVKNDFVKSRGAILAGFEDYGDGTGTNFHSVTTSSDKFQNRKYVADFDWTTFNLKSADYITFGAGHLDYIVAMVNPFK